MTPGAGKAQIEVALACLIYGMAGIFLEYIDGMGTGSILFYEMLIGAVTILLYLLWKGRLSELRLKEKRKFLLLQGIFTGLTFFCYFAAIKLTCLSVAVLLHYTAPVYVTLLSPLLLKEKISSRSYLALFLAISGVIMVVKPEIGIPWLEWDENYRLGILLGVISGISYAAVILNIRYLKDEYSEMALAFWPLVIIVLLTAPFAAGTSGATVKGNLGVLLTFGLISGGLGEILYTEGLSGIEAQVGSILALIEPVSGIFFDYTLLGVPFCLNTCLGCMLILAAGLLVSLENIRGLSGKSRVRKGIS
ncbi:integral membrane protein [Methanosarcina sp. MTP4]|uniref:DMT family transporter n=1 Tax=Methanosarcina sp. MTP4 TaxID=1434100 RepID=UPI000615E6D6|nr:EamA family transporter [Methanosarcina sp. MTP4]AKB25543.1 integral membrane protein [Methanosarcina sp. MTP4]